MAVNLNGIDLSGAAASSAQKASTTQSPPAGAQTATPKSSSQPDVSITSTASLLANLQQSLASKPAVDEAKVVAISKQLASGTYHINPDKIAGGLIETERALGKLN